MLVNVAEAKTDFLEDTSARVIVSSREGHQGGATWDRIASMPSHERFGKFGCQASTPPGAVQGVTHLAAIVVRTETSTAHERTPSVLNSPLRPALLVLFTQVLAQTLPCPVDGFRGSVTDELHHLRFGVHRRQVIEV